VSEIVRTEALTLPRNWQLRPWPNDPTSMLLIFVDHLSVPGRDELEAALGEARRLGAHRVRTSALFPRAAEVAFAHGFHAIDRLCLLRLPLDDALDHRVESRFGTSLPHTRPLRAWHHNRAADVDRAAFGELWGNDAASLADIRRATPHHRARMIGRRRMAGFAISGCGGDSGYLQRVAVAPDQRRRGVALALVADALAWMRRRPLTTAYVNTGFDNVAALALYEGLGFVRMDDDLTIVERLVER
jgi:ribosomal-protein-alanine N-acetyltransferase